MTGDKKYLEKSANTFRFVMSGHDNVHGGGGMTNPITVAVLTSPPRRA